MQGTTEMITVTYPWWAFFLFFFFIVPVIRLADYTGEKLGHWSYRTWHDWRESREPGRGRPDSSR
jgi:hypothetical protein